MISIRRKKGQMEILGLALIIVLISLGFLFVVKFRLSNANSPDITKSVRESALASNIINTMLSTTAEDCSNYEMQELIRDCSLNRGTVCGKGMNSCEYANDFFGIVLTKTLDTEPWKRGFFFKVTNVPIDMNRNTSACTGERESKFFAVPVEVGRNVVITLDICD